MNKQTIIGISLAALLSTACGPDKDPVGKQDLTVRDYPARVQRIWSDKEGCQEYRITIWDKSDSKYLLIHGTDGGCDGVFEQLGYRIPSDHPAAFIAPAELTGALKGVYEPGY